jgi:hypothetical protein
MVSQKRKSAKYRKNLTNKQKRQIQTLKDSQVARQTFDLYALPLDIKVKIFRLAISGNMEKWSQTHRRHMKGVHAYISYVPSFSEASIKPMTLCRDEYTSECAMEYFPYLTEEYDSEVYENIRSRSLGGDIYWHNERCRCFTCDRVRGFMCG